VQIWGVELKHPSPRELAIATAIILAYLVVWLIATGAAPRFPDLAAIAIGAIAASFGLSPGKGWRACILLLIVSAITFILVQVLLGILAPV
jgi:hypothetical protein